MESTTQIFQTQPFKTGQLIAGRYRVISFLGAGSMGWVLKVADEALSGEVVALKVLYPHLSRDRTSALRFRQEVVLARQLAHPAIIHVHDFEESTEGETFIALEFVDGASLDCILKEQHGVGLPFDEALLILARVAEALLYAHQQGVLHRDLKPSNILVSRDGSIKLTDFGLAKSFQQEFGLTRTGEALGTPRYMAPEQFRAEPTDQRTDIYAFGILAYELVVGHLPFLGDDFFALAEQHIATPIAFNDKRIMATPDWFKEMIRDCCEKKPSDRPLSLAEVLPLIVENLPGRTQLTMALRHIAPTHRVSRRAQRIMLGSVVMAILSALAVWAWQQTTTRVFISSHILMAEYRMGIELTPLKRILDIRSSLLRPETAFDTLSDERALQMAFLFTADETLRKKDGSTRPSLADLRDSAGYTLLQRVAQTNLGHQVDALADCDLDFNQLDPNGDSALTASLKANLIHSFRALTTIKSFRIDGADSSGDLPIHVAVRTDNHDAATFLIAGAKNPGVSLRNRSGDHALHLAARLSKPQMLSFLLGTGIDATVRDSEGRTVLMEAVRARGPAHETAELLNVALSPRARSAGVDIEALDNDGMSALMHALDAKNELAVRRLIAAGAKLNHRSATGLTAYDLARQNDLLRYLPAEQRDG